MKKLYSNIENNFTKTIKEYLIFKLEEAKSDRLVAPIKGDLQDLGWLLLEEEHNNGVVSYSDEEARDFISINLYPIGWMLEWLYCNGVVIDFNPFLEVNKLELLCYDEGFRVLLEDLQCLKDSAIDENVTLTDDLIDSCIKELKQFKYDIDLYD